MSNINQFRSQIIAGGGLINSNRFNVIITPPVPLALSGVSGRILNPETVQLPGSQIGTFENQTARNPIKYPNIRTYEDVAMTFLVTQDYEVVNFFKRWHDYILSKDGYKVKYLEEYAGQIEIQHVNRKNEVKYSVDLINAWPVGVNSIDLDAGASDIPTKLNVAFTYERFNENRLNEFRPRPFNFTPIGV